MVKIVLTVEGMMCGMCESHINDAVRTDFPVKKVTSSVTKEPYVKKGLFSFGK
jgi:copper chaperone CopZ